MKKSFNFAAFFTFGLMIALQSQAQDDLLITSFSGSRVERYDAETGQYLGPFIPQSSGGLSSAAGIAVGPDDNLYVTSWGGNEILCFDGESGAFLSRFASQDGLFRPNNIVFNDGFFYVTQTAAGPNGFVRRYDAQTGAFTDFLDVAFGDGLAIDGDSILVSNFGGGVERFDLATGAFVETFIPEGTGGLANPTAILLLDDRQILVSSFGTDSVKRFDSQGNFVDDVITDLFQPEGLGLGPDGNLYAGSFGSGIVNRYDATTFEFVSEFSNVGGNTNFFIFRESGILLGDVNLDGVADLLDVFPFVELVISSQFQAEADINQDSVVDLLDVAPLVEILTGQ